VVLNPRAARRTTPCATESGWKFGANVFERRSRSIRARPADARTVGAEGDYAPHTMPANGVDGVMPRKRANRMAAGGADATD